jgi:hypothetical protein
MIEALPQKPENKLRDYFGSLHLILNSLVFWQGIKSS